MRIRWGPVVSVLTCSVLLTGYRYETSSAQAVPNQPPSAGFSGTTAGATEGDNAPTLAPGHFRFTTGLDKIPQPIQGPVTCDTRDDVYRIAIGDPDAGGIEIGLTHHESFLKYVDLGNREGVNLMMINDGDGVREAGETPPAVHKAGDTYFASGYATGVTASQHDTDRYFEIAVACP